jgi:uncharacterized protein DUF2064
MNTGHRCVLVFSRSPEREGALKGIAEARGLFELSERRLARAASALPGVALVKVGSGQQRGRDFGARLRNAFRDVLALGYTEVVAVGSDVPSLGAAELAAAFEALGRGETPLGPSPDGGVYLIGACADPSSLFEGVRWLGPHVLGDLLRALEARGARAALLAPLTDVDARRDLVLLAADPRLDPELRRLLRALLRGDSARADRARGRSLPALVSLASPRAPPLAA